MARGQSAYNRHVSKVMASEKPRSRREAQIAMRHAADSWKGRSTESNPAGGTSMVKLLLLGAAALFVLPKLLNQQTPTPASGPGPVGRDPLRRR